jgi:hypothetical protein
MYLEKVIDKISLKKNLLLASFHAVTKKQDPDPKQDRKSVVRIKDPDPYQNITD